jgi:hypothetical protein
MESFDPAPGRYEDVETAGFDVANWGDITVTFWPRPETATDKGLREARRDGCQPS